MSRAFEAVRKIVEETTRHRVRKAIRPELRLVAFNPSVVHARANNGISEQVSVQRIYAHQGSALSDAKLQTLKLLAEQICQVFGITSETVAAIAEDEFGIGGIMALCDGDFENAVQYLTNLVQVK